MSSTRSNRVPQSEVQSWKPYRGIGSIVSSRQHYTHAPAQRHSQTDIQCHKYSIQSHRYSPQSLLVWWTHMPSPMQSLLFTVVRAIGKSKETLLISLPCLDSQTLECTGPSTSIQRKKRIEKKAKDIPGKTAEFDRLVAAREMKKCTRRLGTNRNLTIETKKEHYCFLHARWFSTHLWCTAYTVNGISRKSIFRDLGT